MKNKSNEVGVDPIWDVRTLSKSKQLLLGFQHLFAMFGATVLVPLLTGLDISTTLLMSGIGTLLFHLITKNKVPVYLGSSFAFLAGYQTLAPLISTVVNGKTILEPDIEGLQYANGGLFISGIVFLLIAFLIKKLGVNKVMRFFPPIVTGPIIICIGLSLAPNAINQAKSNWLLALVAVVSIIIFNIFGKGMVKIIPIMLGIIIAYVVALITKQVDFSLLNNVEAFAVPLDSARFMKLNWEGVAVMVPISIATLMEHIGDISAVSATTGQNYLKDPGLHRTLAGDAVATSLSGFFGGPDMTTYGENIGVMALTKVYDPRVMRIAAVLAAILSFFPAVSAFIRTIPEAIIGGVSIILYGMIASTGVRNLVENKIDLSKSRNMIIAGCIFVSGLGFGEGLQIGNFTIPGIAVAAVIGILLNVILPGNEYQLDVDQPNPSGTGSDFSVRNREADEEEETTEVVEETKE